MTAPYRSLLLLVSQIAFSCNCTLREKGKAWDAVPAEGRADVGQVAGTTPDKSRMAADTEPATTGPHTRAATGGGVQQCRQAQNRAR